MTGLARTLGRAVAALALLAAAGAAEACRAVDFLALSLPPGDPVEVALETAFPGSDLDRRAGLYRLADGQTVPYAPPREVTPKARLDGATLGDSFVYRYPLAFDLTQRRQPYHDPGRVRNDAFFRATFFDDKASARRSLAEVGFANARFWVTTKHCVHAQLTAAFAEIARLGPGVDPFFQNVGGSFNWRVISGTDRLSAHSFGIAIDLNASLGGYWKWDGVPEGQAGAYDNRIPPEIVQAMERYGFIWGGKWHHYDGMHFEYRPELILYARLVDRRS